MFINTIHRLGKKGLLMELIVLFLSLYSIASAFPPALKLELPQSIAWGLFAALLTQFFGISSTNSIQKKFSKSILFSVYAGLIVSLFIIFLLLINIPDSSRIENFRNGLSISLLLIPPLTTMWTLVSAYASTESISWRAYLITNSAALIFSVILAKRLLVK